jgi:hypothetical protein
MGFMTADGRMWAVQLPVWVTVIISRFVSGFVIGFLVAALLSAGTVSISAQGEISRGTILRFAAVAMVVGVLVTGLVTYMLLPRLSGVTVGVGTAMLATFAGQLVPLIGMLAFARALAGGADPSRTLLLFGGMSPFVALALNVAGIALTAWMLATSSVSSGRSVGARYDLYNRAYRESLDDDT